MSSLFSARWHRVAALKPRLVSPLRVRRQWQRGETWWVLGDPAGGRHVRLNAAAHALVARLDGRHTMAALWEWQLAQPHCDTASQDELVELLAQLREAGLVQFDRAADFDSLLPHLEREARGRTRGTLLAWRVPLANPSRVLDRLAPLAPLVFSRAAFVAWVAAAVSLGVLALFNAPALWSHGERWLATPRYALLAALLYVPLKLAHEAGHALAVRRFGGVVRDAGVTLMLGLPVPYVDASAASSFERRQRVLVGAAGMMTEVALAALALPLWLWLDDGLARDAAFVTLLMAGVSTLVFNANPLQRLDGYFIATDLLELPNLAPRSRQWWQRLLQRHALRLPGAEPLPVAPGEAPWLAAYAPLAWGLGVLVAALATAWLGQLSLWLGLAAAVVLGWQMLARPVVQMWRGLRRSALAQPGSAARWRRLSAAAALVALAVALAPLPQRLVVQGVVWPADEALLRSEEDGFVEALLAADGDTVQAGQPVARLANPMLSAALQRQRARIALIETTLTQTMAGRGGATGSGGDSRAANLRAELAAANAQAERLHERHAALTLRAAVAGRLVLPPAGDLAGRYLRRGELLGRVLDGSAPRVRLPWPQARTDELRAGAPAVQVRLAGERSVTHAAQLERDAFAAVAQLPSAALSTRHGGDVLTDPADARDTKPLQPVVLLDVRLAAVPAAPDEVSAAAPGARVGERAWVRFDAGFAPLAWQAVRWVQQRVQRSFNPQI
jgi:putative peptide zinc metalloprotease protein